MPTRTLNVVIAGDAKQLGVATKQADKHMEGTEKRAGRMGSAVKAGFGVAAAGAGLLVVGLKKSVDAAIEAEKSQARMVAQLRASGISYRAHAKEIDAVIQKHSKLAGVDDEELQDAFTGIVRATGSVSTAMKDMGLVTDLMRARNISAAKAGDLLAKVHNGNVGALKRMGIAIVPVTAAQDKLAASNDHATAAQRRAAKAADTTATAQKALGELQKRVAGQAEAYGKTAAGAQARFGVAVENLQEKIGGKLLPVLTKAAQGVAKFAGEMDDGTGSGGSFARQIGGLTRALGPYANATSDAVSETKKHKTVMTALGDSFPNPMRSVKFFTGALNLLKKASDGVVASVKAMGSALKWAGNAAKDAGGFLKGAADTLNPLGDGLGKAASNMQLPAFGGGLMGARPSMAPFAGAAARFGLHVSSGRRPGAITSSGNASYHSSGEAIDVAGSPAGMLGFFRQMRATQGSRLAELIYTPGGAGVKNGHSYTYGGQVARDHYDHVHVAFDTGVPGVGDGIGQIKSLWTSAGGSSSAQNMAAAVAMAESGGNPTITHRNSDGSIDRGLWQINSVHGALSTTNRLGNAKAAVSISSNGRNWNPWTVFKTGAYKRFLGSAGSTPASSGGSSGSSTPSKPKSGTASGGALGGYDPAVVYATENAAGENVFTGLGSQGGVQGFLAARAGASQSRPLKGGGPTKGFPSGYTPPEPGPAGPTRLDYIEAAIAEAGLTPGTADDIAALTEKRSYAGGQLELARQSGDPRLIAEAATNFKSAIDAVDQLTEAVTANTAAIDEQKKSFEALIAADYRSQFNVSQSQYGILAQAVADASNRGIGQILGLSLSGLRSAPGAVART